jgi:hypothetical protein
LLHGSPTLSLSNIFSLLPSVCHGHMCSYAINHLLESIGVVFLAQDATLYPADGIPTEIPPGINKTYVPVLEYREQYGARFPTELLFLRKLVDHMACWFQANRRAIRYHAPPLFSYQPLLLYNLTTLQVRVSTLWLPSQRPIQTL